MIVSSLLLAAALSVPSSKEVVLYVGAHPDDLEAVAGLALRMKDDYDFRVVDFTRGEGGCGPAGFYDGSTGRKRVEEERRACAMLGCEPVFLSQTNFQGRLAFADRKVTGELEELIWKLKPKAVITHWPVDTHADHVQCSAAVQHAVSNLRRDRKFKTELYFNEEPPWQTMNFRPTYYVDVTAVETQALALVRCYVCQNGEKIAQNKATRMRERGREAPVPVTCAEAYTTFTGEPLKGGVLERYAIAAPKTSVQTASDEAFVRGVRRRQATAEILWTKPICKEPGRFSYIGWPTACRRKSGELIAVFSGGRLAHVCPYGKVQLVRSLDGGETWSAPETVRDSTLDDRDAGITELDNGDLLLVSFSSVCFMWRFKDEYARVPAADRRRDCGYFSLRSTDGGRTWEDPVRMHSSANHGAVQLKDGRVLLVGRRRPDGGNFLPEDVPSTKFELVVEESTDRGRSWHVLAKLLPQAPYELTKFHEPHLVECKDGRLRALFRHHGGASIVQTVSQDGGRTWGPFEDTPIAGLPPHLMRSASGDLVCSTACRSDKRAVELVTVSRDDGATWDTAHAVELVTVASTDMGYPSTVQNDDGTFVTVYYQPDRPGEKPCLMATKWRMAPYDAEAEAACRRDAEERRARALPTRPATVFRTEPAGVEIAKMSNGLQMLRPGAVYHCQNVPSGAEIEARFLLSVSFKGEKAPAMIVGGRKISLAGLTDDSALLGDLVPVVVERKGGELSVRICGTSFLRENDASVGPLPIAFDPGTGGFSMCNGTIGARQFADSPAGVLAD